MVELDEQESSDYWYRIKSHRRIKCFQESEKWLEIKTQPVNVICINASGGWALSGNKDKTLYLWELETGFCLCKFKGHDDIVTGLCLSGDEQWGLSASADTTLRLWEIETGDCLRVMKGHIGCVNAVCMSADGRWALSAGEDKTLRLWDVARGEYVRVMEGHSDSLMRYAWP